MYKSIDAERALSVGKDSSQISILERTIMMEDSESRIDLGVYDTALNVIGGVKDYGVIFKAIDSHFSQSDSFKDLVNLRNEFHLRTERSRTRVERAVRKNFLEFKNQDHQDLIRGIFKDNVPLQDKELVLMWQLALNSRLFREITVRAFSKIYYSGRAGISKDDVTAYLQDFISRDSSLEINWSRSTINTISTKYLNLMTKLNFLESGRTKRFKHIRPSSEVQVLFLYFAKLYNSKTSNILVSELLPLSFFPVEDIRERLKKLSSKGFFDMDFNGVALNVELTHSYKGICDVLYNRPQTKVFRS